MTEKVLVFDSKKLHNFKWLTFTGFSTRSKDLNLFKETIIGNSFFIDRKEAENNEAYKQIIPYCVIKKGNKILTYKRTKAGGESRLHDKLSIGVGGHINPIDEKLLGSNIIELATKRELEEELNWGNININLLKFIPRGLIYDDSSEVGKVHFGLFLETHVINCFYPVLKEDSLSEMEWLTQEELAERKNFESWSQMIIDHYNFESERECHV